MQCFAHTQATNETPSRPSAPDIPKSPPKWPLRPGVLVHVKCDTKQNLCANRAQSPNNISTTTSNLNVSYASPLNTSKNTSIAASGKQHQNDKKNVSDVSTADTAQPVVLPELPARNNKLAKSGTSTNPSINDTKPTKSSSVANRIRNSTKLKSGIDQTDTNCERDVELENGCDAATLMIDERTTHNKTTNNDGTEQNNDELLSFTSSNLIERLLGRLRWRREHIKRTIDTNGNVHNKHSGSAAASNKDENILSKSNKRAVSLLRATGWFGSGKSTNSTMGLMSENERTPSSGGNYVSQSQYYLQKYTQFIYKP